MVIPGIMFGSEREVNFDTREGTNLFLALVVMFYAIARLVGVAVHEFMGHGLFTELMGGEFYAVYISPGNGYASIYLPPGTDQGLIALGYLAGILVELVIGCIILVFVYPRMRSLTSSLFTLVLSEIMLVHSSLYLVLGAYISNGDTRLASLVGGIQADVLIISGLILTGVFILVISVRFVQFISNFDVIKDERRASRALSLFWLPPIFIIWGSILIPGEVASEDRAYSIVYGSLVMFFVLLSMFYVPRLSPKRFDFEKREGLRLDRVISTFIVFIIAISLWLAVFGASSETAHGLMLKEPPIEAERYYRDYMVGNAILDIDPNGTVSVSIMMKGVMENPSGLQEKLYETFEDRPYWQDYEGGGRNMMRIMFSLTKEQGENLTFEQAIWGSVWGGGQTYPNARILTTRFNFSDMGVSVDDDGNITVKVIDPWMVGSNPGFLDGIEFRWSGNMTLLEYDTGNITPVDNDPVNNFVIWRNMDLASAPTGYKIILKNNG